MNKSPAVKPRGLVGREHQPRGALRCREQRHLRPLTGIEPETPSQCTWPLGDDCRAKLVSRKWVGVCRSTCRHANTGHVGRKLQGKEYQQLHHDINLSDRLTSFLVCSAPDNSLITNILRCMYCKTPLLSVCLISVNTTFVRFLFNVGCLLVVVYWYLFGQL